MGIVQLSQKQQWEKQTNKQTNSDAGILDVQLVECSCCSEPKLFIAQWTLNDYVKPAIFAFTRKISNACKKNSQLNYIALYTRNSTDSRFGIGF